MFTNRRLATVAIFTVVVGLSGCGATATPSGDVPRGDNHPSGATNSGSEESPGGTQSGVQAFGKAYTWDGGLSLTVSKPKAYTPSDSSSAMMSKKFKHFRAFDIVVVNKTSEPVDLSLFHATVQSSNEEGEQVFDYAKGFEGSPSTKLLPQRESKFKIAFGLKDPKDIVMEVTPGMFEYDSVIFQL